MSRLILRAAALLVPGRARREWLEEWESELDAAAEHAEMSTGSMAWGAVVDALTQFQHWRLGTLARDLKYAFRTILKSPVMSAVVVVTLALGIGVNAAIYSIVDRVLLRPLALESPEQLVRVWGENGEIGDNRLGTSYADLHDYREMTTAFDGFGGYSTSLAILNGEGLEPSRIPVLFATDDLLPILGARPVVGRLFTEAEHGDLNSTVVLLSERFYQTQFGGDPQVLGQRISLGGTDREVIGVLPRDFNFGGSDIAAYVPAQQGRTGAAANESVDGFGRDWRQVWAVARIAEGTSVLQAQTDLRRVATLLEEEYPATNTGHSVRLQPYHETLVAGVNDILTVLMIAVGGVLLIACLNIASLQIARGAGRQREIALRSAIGAARSNLITQLVTESLVLATLGGLAGIGLGAWVLDALLTTAPFGIPRISEIAMDARIFTVLLAVTVGSGLFFGLIPAWQATSGDLQVALRDGGRVGQDKGKHRLRAGLVVSELALATTLVTAAAMFYSSFSGLNRIDPGFESANVITLRLNMPMNRYSGSDGDRWSATNVFFTNLLNEVRDIPGVENAALSYRNPLEPGFAFTWGVHVDGREELARAQRPQGEMQPITAGYFDTFQIPILEGRDISSFDVKSAPGVVVLSEALAHRLFPQGGALGSVIDNPPFWVPAGYPASSEVVGIVGDVRSNGLESGAAAVAYFPFSQTPMGNMRLVVKTTSDPRSLFGTIRQAIWAIDPYLPVDDMTTMDEAIAQTIAPTRFLLTLTGGFAVLSLVLAAVGVYGVVSSTVSERTHEIGVRRAMGAGNREIRSMIVKQMSALIFAGLVIGVGLAQLVGQGLQSLVYGVETSSPGVITVTVMTMIVVGVVSGVIPSRRALRVDPMNVLRPD